MNWLCRLGIHKWHSVDVGNLEPSDDDGEANMQMEQCSRCGLVHADFDPSLRAHIWQTMVVSVIFLALIVGAFLVGRFVGRFDGPAIVTNYLEPPMPTPHGSVIEVHEYPAFEIYPTGWHQGDKWTFRNIAFDGEAQTATGICVQP